MTTRVKQIIWITGNKNPYQRFEIPLQKAGYTVLWVSLPTRVKSMEEWIESNISLDSSGLFIDPNEVEPLEKFCQAKKARLGSIPYFWVVKAPEELHYSQAFTLGVDDFVSADTEATELLARIELRIKTSDLRSRLESHVKDLSLRETKTEIAMKQREEFLSVCAHDLRSPIGIIQTGLGLLLNQKDPLSPFQQEILTRAKRQAGTALNLVSDLLDVMSFEQGLRPQYQLLQLDPLLAEFYSDYKNKAVDKKVGFHYENKVGDWKILADPDRLQQILQNLFNNALKFTEAGKNIYLSVSPFKGRRKTDPPYPMIIISLKDEGKGIPQKEKEKIFDRFTQIKDYSRTEGRGLGLTVARQISKLHEGNIWVESEEGKGSTFHVLFPHVISRNAKVNGNTPGKIVLIEPSDERRAIYAEPLSHWGFKVVGAKDGVEGLALIYHHLPDAVVLSPGLPRLNESEVATLLHTEKLTSEIPLFVVFDPRLGNQRSYEPSLLLRVTRFPFQKTDFDRIFPKKAA